MKNLNSKLKKIIIVEIILLLLVVFSYKYIYEVQATRNIYADASERFVNENKQPVFKIGKIVLYSSANAVDNSDGQLKDIDISQFTDIEITIDNTQKSAELTGENTVNELYIDNINVSTNSQNGTKIFNYKNPFDSAKYTEIENYRDDGILFQIANTNEEDSKLSYYDNVFFTDCSNPISLGYINKNLLTGCEVNSTNGSITFDGSILKSAEVNLKEIKPKFNFTIHITNNFNEKFACNVTIDEDLSADDGGIYTGYLMKIIDTDNPKYNFLKVSDK